MPEIEVELTGGGVNRVVRVGATVRRPVHRWSPAVRVLLGQLRASGVLEAPAWHGVDQRGRDVFDHLPGEVGNYPLSEQVRSETALVSAAQLLRRMHDASVPVVGMPDLPWHVSPIDPVEVICHGDFAQYNCVFTEGRATGVIDFDMAGPGPRRWDIAYALYRFAPLTHPDNTDGFGDAAEQARRAWLFLYAYGCTVREGREALAAVGPRLQYLVDFMRASADAGDANFARHIEEGHADLYLRDIAYVEGRKF
ncbi:aminoglycoside phosphotransferase family protein [Pseudonocardia sp. TRM90224]|uniref:aminoglycoside phosphotransferase family protein n=1 Tax=Pseudonocardia sp. TRM90224 TaxID=2812678 RepID=UPI001E646915|nr:phosphotransferase [Pseudonocardia sp. TRM90224]